MGRWERVGGSTSQKTLPVTYEPSEGEGGWFYGCPDDLIFPREHGVFHYTRGITLIRNY